ncbi:hypothetical protein [Aureibacter tunicatorum]|uniref:Uncharacterized protein n=1 Tax=Aureibacter tunicatorum TaxID=866807 RepID=A0AAE3XM74_9BACT|nr:hypothetical protein [Aureibacter tunicatorum]MDR6238500.1 hypothetical protein [Aureibacter tunicatorum]BDD05567.1 hypothetical protein AUTU_30500 [Aureibacter tunicatorum]
MSAFPELLIIDFQKFSNEIIPAFIEGSRHPLIKDEIKYYNDAYCNKLLEMSWPESLNLQDVFKKHEEHFFEISSQIMVGEQETLVENNQGWCFEDLIVLFERVLVRNCVLYYANLGRSYSIDSIVEVEDSKLMRVLDKLDLGALIWNQGGIGIRGWISETEVRDLAKGVLTLKGDSQYKSQFETLVRMISIAAENNYGLLYSESLFPVIEKKINIEKVNTEIVKLSIQRKQGAYGEPVFIAEGLC